MSWYTFHYDGIARPDYDDYVVESKCFSDIPGQPATRSANADSYSRRTATLKEIWQWLDGKQMFSWSSEYLTDFRVERGEVTEKDKFLIGWGNDEMLQMQIPGFFDGPVYSAYCLVPKSCLTENKEPYQDMEADSPEFKQLMAEMSEHHKATFPIRQQRVKEYREFLAEKGAAPKRRYPAHLQFANDELAILVPDVHGVYFHVTYGGVALCHGEFVGGKLTRDNVEDYVAVEPTLEIIEEFHRFSEEMAVAAATAAQEEAMSEEEMEAHINALTKDIEFDDVLEAVQKQEKAKLARSWSMEKYADFSRQVGDNVYDNDGEFNVELINYLLPAQWNVDERFLDQASEAWVPVVDDFGNIGVLTWPNSD